MLALEQQYALEAEHGPGRLQTHSLTSSGADTRVYSGGSGITVLGR